MQYPRVSIIVLNWNGWRDTIACLESLFQITYPNYVTVLVDNGSTDGSIEKVKEWAEGKIPVEDNFFQYKPEGKPIRCLEYDRKEAEGGIIRQGNLESMPSNKKLIIIKNEDNLGCAKAFNIGYRFSFNILHSDYAIILNNDTVVAQDFLDQLVRVAEKRPESFLSALVYYYHNPEEIWSAGGMINYWTASLPVRKKQIIDKVALGDPYEPDWICNCCTLMPRSMFENVGVMDERFFFGSDEVDICIRARKKGFRPMVVPRSKIWHKGLFIPEGEPVPPMRYYMIKYKLLLMEKHWGKARYAVAILYLTVDYLRQFVTFLLFSRNWKGLKAFLNGIKDYLGERKKYKNHKEEL